MTQFESLRLVPQQDEYGCGVACVASILSISYDAARRDLVKEKNDVEIDDKKAPGLELHHLALALKGHDYHVVADWDEPTDFEPGTIVLVGHPRGGLKHEHYILSVGGGMFMDPWINYPTKPRQAGIREGFPSGKIFYVSLVPKPGNHPH